MMKDILKVSKIISCYSKEEALRRFAVTRDRFADENISEYQRFDFLTEAMMLSQVIMRYAGESVEIDKTSEDLKIKKEGFEELDMNTDSWIQVPKDDDMKFWQDKYGLRTWNNFDHHGRIIGIAQRSYYWCDRVLIMDSDRKILQELRFSDFIKSAVALDWTPEMPDKKE